MPLEDLKIRARFLWALPSFLRHPISLEQARAAQRLRLERREPDFLDLLRRAIYAHAASPYRELLRLAGCEYGDLERLVSHEGVEGTLHILLRHGVYLSVDELKGRRRAVRGSSTLAVNPALLRNPSSTVHVLARSSGSRGTPAAAPFDLGGLHDMVVNTCLFFDARGATQWPYALWLASGGATLPLLVSSGFGAVPARWFLQVEPGAPGLHPRPRWSPRIMRLVSLLAGVRLPRPQHVPLHNPLPIVQWMAEVLRAGSTPHLRTFASAAARVCQTALDAGVDLRGAQFWVGGEPVTAARLAVIRRAGGEAVPGYGSSEAGAFAYGCLAPTAPDEVHLAHDCSALIQVGPEGKEAGFPPRALLISSLRPTAPLVLLNVSLGDQAILTQRACGCPLERLGWTTHLHTIRSYEKLTAAGMNFLDTDVIRALEVVLPGRFGGGPLDYQLLEEEADDGRPALRLLVHPAVGPLEEEAVADAFLAAIGGGSGEDRVMELQWRRADLLRVERRPPLTTASGKILHLYQQRHRHVVAPG